MSNAFSFVELLEELTDAELQFRREAGEVGGLTAAGLELPGGRQVVAVERGYRKGIRIIIEPTPQELEIARTGDLWHLWESERSRWVGSLLPVYR